MRRTEYSRDTSRDVDATTCDAPQAPCVDGLMDGLVESTIDDAHGPSLSKPAPTSMSPTTLVRGLKRKLSSDDDRVSLVLPAPSTERACRLSPSQLNNRDASAVLVYATMIGALVQHDPPHRMTLTTESLVGFLTMLRINLRTVGVVQDNDAIALLYRTLTVHRRVPKLLVKSALLQVWVHVLASMGCDVSVRLGFCPSTRRHTLTTFALCLSCRRFLPQSLFTCIRRSK